MAKKNLLAVDTEERLRELYARDVIDVYEFERRYGRLLYGVPELDPLHPWESRDDLVVVRR